MDRTGGLDRRDMTKNSTYLRLWELRTRSSGGALGLFDPALEYCGGSSRLNGITRGGDSQTKAHEASEKPVRIISVEKILCGSGPRISSNHHLGPFHNPHFESHTPNIQAPCL